MLREYDTAFTFAHPFPVQRDYSNENSMPKDFHPVSKITCFSLKDYNLGCSQSKSGTTGMEAPPTGILKGNFRGLVACFYTYPGCTPISNCNGGYIA